MQSLRFVVALAIGAAAFGQESIPNAQRVLQQFAQGPLTLEPNRGQAPKGVDFIASSVDHKFWLSATGARLEIFEDRKSVV